MSKKDLELERMILECFKNQEQKNKEKTEEKVDTKVKIKKLGKHPLAK